MKKYLVLAKYFRGFTRNIILYVVFTLLSIAFGIFSIGMLIPFLQMLFDPPAAVAKPDLAFNSGSVLAHVNYFIGTLIEEHGKIKTLGLVCITIIVCVFFKNVFAYLTTVMLTPIRSRALTRLRNDIYSKIIKLPIGYFTEKRKGDILSRMTHDTWELEISVMSTLEAMVRDPFTIIIYLATLVFLSPQLSLLLFIFLPLIGFVIGRVSRSLKKEGSLLSIKNGISISIVDETLHGLRVIKAFNAEKLLHSKFAEVNDELYHVKNRMSYRRELASPMSEFLGVLALAGMLYFGGSMVLSGSEHLTLTPAGFIGFIGLFTQIINPAKGMSNSFYNLQRGSAALARVNEILEAKSTVFDQKNGKTLTTFSESIEFRNVNFAYDDIEVLKNINLKIQKGQTVALVGSSGAGKSTLADLVPRFHDVTSGELLIDGVNIKEYTLESVRSQISIVTQEPILFNDTIANNIALGMQDARPEEIEEAARVANAYNFIINKEEGFQSNIGDRGTKLSGGERQRLTIARALLKNPPILILDEATSSLDTESERLVQDAVNKMMQNRTSIVIAHRLSTVRHADEIIVLDKGEIVERGTHNELIAHNGRYRKLVEMQEVK